MKNAGCVLYTVNSFYFKKHDVDGNKARCSTVLRRDIRDDNFSSFISIFPTMAFFFLILEAKCQSRRLSYTLFSLFSFLISWPENTSFALIGAVHVLPGQAFIANGDRKPGGTGQNWNIPRPPHLPFTPP